MPRPDNSKPYGLRILRLKDPLLEGRDVWELQIKLIGWGSGTDNDGIGNTMDPVRVTGKFDMTTRDAVMRFQKTHSLAINGIVDSAVYRAIDREAALHAVPLHDMKCPCARGDNDAPILCRCGSHPDDGKVGKCTGFGQGRFANKSLVDGKKLADDTDISNEKLDVYDMEEYAGMDKALLWAVRALLHRSALQAGDTYHPISIVSGYRCWFDNYHHTDESRWRHRRSTFHLGKAVQFFIRDHCTNTAWDDTSASCPQCDALRKVAVEKCGFQLRWQEPNRISVAEGPKEARPPSTPFAMHIDTVRRLDRDKDDFVKTDLDGAKPLYEGKLTDVVFPLDLGEGIHPLQASSSLFFRNIETGRGGWFPLGASRTWHGGVHLYANNETPVRAIADGEIIGCRLGEDEDTHPHGSRNFLLVKHSMKSEGGWKDKVFYSLYMHLDKEKPAADAKIGWRKQLFLKSKKHVEALAPSSFFTLLKKDPGDAKGTFIPCQGGLAQGELIEVMGNEIDPKTLDDNPPADSKAFKLVSPADTYIFIKRDNQEMGKLVDADDTLAAKFTSGEIIGLDKPIKISVGDVIGKVAAGPSHKTIKALGSFVHLEIFAESALPVEEGFNIITAEDETKIADRKEVISTLVNSKLLPQYPDGVILENELKEIFLKGPYNFPFRSVLLKSPNLWSVDWKKAFEEASCYGFMKDNERDALGKAFNKYNWWKDVKNGGGALPDSTVVYHYHPISMILQLALAATE
jgi:hypothetical protein